MWVGQEMGQKRPEVGWVGPETGQKKAGSRVGGSGNGGGGTLKWQIHPRALGEPQNHGN